MKIFVSAYACEPNKGSEPGIGWNTVLELAKYHEVHVLTRANNLPSIQEALAHYEGAKPIFHGYDLPHWLTFWKKKRRGYHLYYYLWQYGAYFAYRKFVNEGHFDVVQHLTFANWAMPSLFMLCKGMTVYGPIGEVHTPKAVCASLPFMARIKDTLRRWGMWLFTHLELFRILTPRCADVILESGHEGGASGFPSRFAGKILQQPQTGINPREPEYAVTRQRKSDDKVRLLICSEFMHWKGVTFACEVFGRIAKQRQNVELEIVGQGAEKGAMEQILAKHGVAERVTWRGFVSKGEMLQALCDADVLLYPSYHHGLATVILQAMWAGLPIVAMLDDPVAQAVGEGAGLVAQGKNMNEILDDLTAKTLELVDSFELRQKYGEGGRQLIAEKYNWTTLCSRLNQLLVSKKARLEK